MRRGFNPRQHAAYPRRLSSVAHIIVLVVDVVAS
jgi:hypothetical protein